MLLKVSNENQNFAKSGVERFLKAQYDNTSTDIHEFKIFLGQLIGKIRYPETIPVLHVASILSVEQCILELDKESYGWNSSDIEQIIIK